jgi:NADP-dependent 3-hydroxy acid dehydrogenase YdfG
VRAAAWARQPRGISPRRAREWRWGACRRDRIQALARELSRRDGNAIAVTTDVADREQVKALVDAAVQGYGRVDVMINNAGVMP